MKELTSCDGGISSEHLISKSIILFLKQDGDFSISGAPWLEDGETRILAPDNLTANCLCRKHNSALSPLDSAALKFFVALRACWENTGPALRYLISGHDLERWLLKTLKAMAVSRNLARGRERLSGIFQQDIQLIDMLDDHSQWPRSTGLYLAMKHGSLTENHNRFQLAPLSGTENDIIAGLWANILGLSFVVMLEPPDMANSPSLQNAAFRPGSILITIGNVTSRIDISWNDRMVHTPVSLNFLRKVQT